ncbi:hypothetical protein AB0B42_10820 [Streptomyces fradiae]|uniref:hypothetical protein n=1 Tax=Streptomyces fradiae TaxID=1906 RepID=UPI0033E1E73A
MIEAMEEHSGRIEHDGVLVARAVVPPGQVDAITPFGHEPVGRDVRVEGEVEQRQRPAPGQQGVRVGKQGQQRLDGHGRRPTACH